MLGTVCRQTNWDNSPPIVTPVYRSPSTLLWLIFLCAGTGCLDLDVQNPNVPDADRALATPGDVESLIAGAYDRWLRVHRYGGPTMFLSVAAGEHGSPWSGCGMEYYGRIPRVPSANTGRPPTIAMPYIVVDPQDSVEIARGGRAGFNTIRIKPDRATAGVTHVGEGPADCIPVLYVNGTWWGLIDEACDSGPDGKFVPSDIEAIEIYNRPSVLPDQFNSGREAQECGVVVLWLIGRQ